MPAYLLAIPTALCCVLLACGGSSSDVEAATTVPSTTLVVAPTTTTSDTPDQAAVRKVAEAWSKEAQRLGADPDPNDPVLDRYLTGELLRDWRSEWARRQTEGIASKPAVDSQAFYRIDRIVVRGASAVLSECVLDDGILYEVATGQILDDGIETTQMTTTAIRAGGRWKLAVRTALTTSKGRVGCALA